MTFLNSLLFINFLFLSFIYFVLTENACYWPSNCEEEHDFSARNGLRCELNSAKSLNFSLDANIGGAICDTSTSPNITFISFLPPPFATFILDSKFDFLNLAKHLSHTTYQNVFPIIFTNLHGFELNAYDPKDWLQIEMNNIPDIYFIKSKFAFFLNNKLVESCNDLLDTSKVIIWNTTSSIFQISRYFTAYTYLKSCDFSLTVCPLVFHDTDVFILEIDRMVSSFFKTNVLRFSPYDNMKIDKINSNVESLRLFKVENINLDSSLLKKEVFNNINNIFISGFVNSIQNDVFKSFRLLKTITLNFKNLRNFFQTNGIAWVEYLNEDFSVDLSASIVRLDKKFDRHKCSIIISFEYFWVETFYTLPNLFPDEDFCLYSGFPFHRLVYIFDTRQFERNGSLFNTPSSCTHLWLIQFYPVYYNFSQEWLETFDKWIFIRIRELVKACEFEKRLRLCANTCKSIGKVKSWRL